jgi:hypothetical protein
MLDINICNYVLRRHPPGMQERFSRLEGRDLAIGHRGGRTAVQC